ncbi:MAG: YitT family protein [Dysosmobacter sp.]|nr:YitT family protein [Dysosmobacter sp.]
MMYNSLHHRWLRLLAAMLGEGVVALALNLFLVPLHLYSGGLMGLCQLIRTLLQEKAGLSFGGADIAGVLYFLSNIPILLLGYKTLGRAMTFKTIACTVSFSFFYSVIPSPSVPIVDDYLTSCLLGGIIVGTASGIILTCGGSGGGLDIVGLCLSKRGSRFTVGKFSLTFNFFLYAACLVLFIPEVAVYSVIYNFFSAMVLDRMHQQNVNVQAMIFTKEDEKELGRFIIEKLGRSVTYWEGTGAYSGKGLHVLVVCLSKFEIEELLHAVHERDSHAFVTVQERVRVFGNFVRKLE